MSSSQWKQTFSLALELPFDSKEEQIWDKLLSEQSRFTDIFITALTMIDIVRLPFIYFSFIKWFLNTGKFNSQTQTKNFLIIQNEINIHLKKRIQTELTGLIESDRDELKRNVVKLNKKLVNFSEKYTQEDLLSKLLLHSQSILGQIKEIEENKDETEETEH